jgi:VanZ family protein
MAVSHAIGAEERVRFLRLRQTIGVVLILSVVYLSLTPHPVELPGEQGDKYGHVLAYATLMLWYALIYPRSRERIGLAVGFVCMGIGLEFLQRLTHYRTFDVADMAADALGVAVGWLAAMPRWSRVSRRPSSWR